MNVFKKGTLNKAITALIVCVVVLVVLIINLTNIDLKYAFQGPKQINNIIELNNTKEGTIIKLKFKRAYETGYSYYVNDEPVAQFLDIEINGKALISIVKNEEVERIINNEKNEDMYIEGILCASDDLQIVDTLEKIKGNYIEDFGEELTEEEILYMFTCTQLINYGVNRPAVAFPIILIICIIVVAVVIIFLSIIIIKEILGKVRKEE
jgi:hypothetical protein